MKILTAIGDELLNTQLKDLEEIEVIGNDILYQEGVLDILEMKKEIDTLAISNLLPEEMNFLYLIDKIKKIREDIEIVVFLDKENSSIETFLNSKKIYKIYYLDENGIEVFINSLKNQDNIQNGISKEILELKQILLENGEYEEKFKEKTESKIIAVSGTPGSGKSVIACILAKQLEMQNKKVIILDYANLNESIKIILGIKEKSENEIIKVNKNLSIYQKTNQFNEENNYYEISKLIESLRNKFDYIIIDTSADLKFKYINTVLNYSNKIIFLLEPNLIGVNKANKMLEVFVNDFNIEIDKIKLVFNKTSKYQIAESVLEEVFSNFQLIGNISYDEKYNLIINKNLQVVDISQIFEIKYEN